ncbi:uncharacterized protein LOC109822548 [Asparagus officinalis]|uniref:uncharacterized protein LOC109822548 n=1 Tax=Asparagus officinalis TaxID=4686 RepID=UPI00098E5085|nr:uncharacterized protein LOC109822548 [Asparagus officinalis]
MAFVSWEEKVISNDKGRRLVHYYLRNREGKRFLAVVGREKSLRHMSYVVTTQFSAMMSAASSSGSSSESYGSYSPSSALDFGVRDFGERMKWKSRRELIYWLGSIVSGEKI